MNYQKLVNDAIKCSPQAQRQLYELYAEAMLGVCFRYTKSMADAEDILQEGFIKVFRNLNQYDFKGELGGWIRKIMVNTALNYLRKNKKYQNDLSFENVPLDPHLIDDPEVKLQGKELAELIRKLPPRAQVIFNLYAVEGYSHVEIASMLGISDGTSKSQYSRARGLLIGLITNGALELKVDNYATK